MHAISRLLIFVGIPLAVYVGVFYVHFKTLHRAGPHDSIMTSAFQASLDGGLASITRGQPLAVVHGSQITLRNTHGRTCWLHSHAAVLGAAGTIKYIGFLSLGLAFYLLCRHLWQLLYDASLTGMGLPYQNINHIPRAVVCSFLTSRLREKICSFSSVHKQCTTAPCKQLTQIKDKI